jgi:3-methyl-2-oxobutanoate hydroxymethyltransferase
VARLTLKDLRAAKGARRLVQVYVRTPREAAACEEAGVDMIVVAEADTGTPNDLHGIREAAAGTFLTVGLEPYTHAGTVEVLRAAYRLVRLGVDAVYCSYGYDTVKTLADEYVPVVGHVGLVPYRSSWFGGMRAVGTTAEDALEVWRRTMRYEEAGAVAVEMELVPTPVATEIARRTSMLVVGMGSGPRCDVQYLFATDVLGDNEGHVPRHATTYRDFRTSGWRYDEAVAAFATLVADVRSGAYPAPRHEVKIPDAALARWRARMG